MIKICLLAVCLLVLISVGAAEDDMSSAQLVQFAVDMTGDANQYASVFGFNTADSRQIAYSSDGKIIQTISYSNIGNGSAFQWGESGNMAPESREIFLNYVGDSGFTWQWSKGDVNQTINVRNSENLYLKQMIGGLREKILLPDSYGSGARYQQEEASGNWWFCGKAINNTGGLPLCAEKIAKKINDGRATARDYYVLNLLEEDYYAFPSENQTPHIVLTKWNITEVDNNLTIKFRAHNFGRKTYNATLMLDMTPKANIVSLEGSDFKPDQTLNWEIKLPEKQAIEIGNYTVHSMKEIEKEVSVPIKDIKINTLKMQLITD